MINQAKINMYLYMDIKILMKQNRLKIKGECEQCSQMTLCNCQMFGRLYSLDRPLNLEHLYQPPQVDYVLKAGVL